MQSIKLIRNSYKVCKVGAKSVQVCAQYVPNRTVLRLLRNEYILNLKQQQGFMQSELEQQQLYEPQIYLPSNTKQCPLCLVYSCLSITVYSMFNDSSKKLVSLNL
jgi:hypothetical protein